MDKKLKEYEVSMQLVVNPSRDIDKAEPELMKVKCIVYAESEEDAKYIARTEHNDGYSVWLTWAYLNDTPDPIKPPKHELQSVLDDMIKNDWVEGYMAYDSDGKLFCFNWKHDGCYITIESLTNWIENYYEYTALI